MNAEFSRYTPDGPDKGPWLGSLVETKLQTIATIRKQDHSASVVGDSYKKEPEWRVVTHGKKENISANQLMKLYVIPIDPEIDHDDRDAHIGNNATFGGTHSLEVEMTPPSRYLSELLSQLGLGLSSPHIIAYAHHPDLDNRLPYHPLIVARFHVALTLRREGGESHLQFCKRSKAEQLRLVPALPNALPQVPARRIRAAATRHGIVGKAAIYQGKSLAGEDLWTIMFLCLWPQLSGGHQGPAWIEERFLPWEDVLLFYQNAAYRVGSVCGERLAYSVAYPTATHVAFLKVPRLDASIDAWLGLLVRDRDSEAKPGDWPGEEFATEWPQTKMARLGSAGHHMLKCFIILFIIFSLWHFATACSNFSNIH